MCDHFIIKTSWLVRKRTHLSSILKSNPIEKENDLYLVMSSINHPIRRPKAPIAITIIILEDLQLAWLNSNNNFLSSYIICIRTMSTSISYLVLFVAAMRAVRIATAVWIALLKTSSMVARYTKVLTTAMKESQKSINWNIFLLTNQYYLMLKLLREREI